jgi:uncharacterized membrane protein (DUF2068 family)
VVRERPTVVSILAIANIVLGGLGLLCGLGGMASAALHSLASHSPGMPSLHDPVQAVQVQLIRQFPNLYWIEGAVSASMCVLAVVLIVAGVGLLYVQAWARWLAIGYGLVTLLVQVSYAVYKLGLVLPASEHFLQNALRQPGSSYPPGFLTGFRVGFMGVLAVQLLFFVGHVALLLIVLSLPSVAAAFAGRRARRFRKEDDRLADGDDGEDERRRPSRNPDDAGRYRGRP